MRTGQAGGLAAEVLAYLSSHPNAADTLEGITNWWLPRQRYERGRRRIQDTLDQLVARGLVVRHCLPDGTIIYARRDATNHYEGTASGY